jgi:hypothetical protein
MDAVYPMSECSLTGLSRRIDAQPVIETHPAARRYPASVALGDEKYIVLTTFRRDGTPVRTTVWAVPLDDGKVGFWTSSESGKAKRLAHTSRVTVQPSDMRGRVKEGTEPVEATARIVSGPEFDLIHEKVVAKYGFVTKFTKMLGAVGGVVKGKRIPYGDRGVIITPSG